jgi:predicted RNA-binding protein with PIN domain
VAAELYIVDGDNVCHLRGPGEDYTRARELLVAEIAGYMAQTGIDAVVVLDGHGQNRSIGRTRVTYSGGETADTIIERLAHRSADGRREVTVVSSDSVLRHVAQRSGVHAMSAREFSDRLSAAPRERFQPREGPSRRLLGDALDPAVREALERMRRGG